MLVTKLAIGVLVLLFVLLVLTMWDMVHGLKTVPWVRTNSELSKRMLTMAEFKEGEHLLDLGSGDGSIVFVAIEQFGAQATGYENFIPLVLWSRLQARWKRLGNKAKFIHADIFAAELVRADVITIFMFTTVNDKLEPLLLRRYPSGTRIVSRTFQFKNLRFMAQETVGSTQLFLYQIP